MTYVFIDEIQHCSDFPAVIDSLYIRKNVDIYLTGSNAYMLSSDIATMISGRYVEIKMMPLSFSEYVHYIQVAASVRDEHPLTRELAPLRKIPDHYPKMTLTLDEDPDADYDGIRRLNALNWLIEQN